MKPISDNIHGAFRSQNLENMVMYDIDRELCGECGRKISIVGHFGAYLCCWNCRYSTCCSKAITSHVNLFHGKTTTSADYSLGTMIILENEMFCICGFKTSSGNKLAKHLAVNGCSSAYTSEKEAEGAKREDSSLEKKSEKRKSKVWFDCKDDVVLEGRVQENVSGEEAEVVHSNNSLGTIEKTEVSAESSAKNKLSETEEIKEFEAAAQSKNDTPEDGLMEGENLEKTKSVPEGDNYQAAIAGVALDPGASLEAAFDLPLS